MGEKVTFESLHKQLKLEIKLERLYCCFRLSQCVVFNPENISVFTN